MVGSHFLTGSFLARHPLRRSIESGFDAINHLIYPPACTMCGESMDGSDDIKICQVCIEAILGNGRRWCGRCGHDMPTISDAESPCKACRGKRLPFRQAIVLAAYEGAMRDAVIAGKRRSGEPLLMSIGKLLGRRVATCVREVPDIITHVPSHWRRQLARGTTPAETLARSVARELKRPLHHALRCKRHTPKQAILPARDRAANIKGAFALGHRYHARGQSFLIIDDVMTTGSTIAEVARVLRRGGARWVAVACAARRAETT